MTDQMLGNVALVPPSLRNIQWDYKVVSIHARHLDILENGLKDLGTECWELVFIHMPMANEYHCVFRRPL